MPMTVLNSTAAQMTLGELNKNITRVGKDLAKISKGERVYNAAADASAYSISEKMRTRLRALNQDERNVQNGVSMLRVAEGGVQDQIEIMKQVKERVINAANDSNTDEDRRIIQKEIDQFYEEIEDIAQKTVYNGRQLLTSGAVVKYTPIEVWKARNKPPLVEGSADMQVIYKQALNHHVARYKANDQPPYPRLDGQEGPFDVFDGYTTESLSRDNLSGGVDGEACKMNMDFSYLLTRRGTAGFEIEDFKDLGFAIKGISETGAEETYQFVLSANPANKYINTHTNYHFFSIDISGCDSMDSVLDKVVDGMKTVRSEQFTHFFDIEKNSDGTGITLTSKNYSTKSNNSEVMGISDSGYVGEGRKTFLAQFARDAATLTNVFHDNDYFSGGVDSEGDYSYDPYNNPDVPPYTPPAQASITRNIESAPIGSGFAVSGYLGDQQYIQFVEGNEINRVKGGVLQVGKNVNVENYDIGAGIRLYLKNGEMTLKSYSSGKGGNNYHIVTDGFDKIEVNYADWKPYDAYTGNVDKEESTKDSSTAVYDLDVSSWRSMDTEELIAKLRGKALQINYYSKNFQNTWSGGYEEKDTERKNWQGGVQNFEFLDKDNPELLGSRSSISYSQAIDLAAMRNEDVQDKNPVDVFAGILKKYIPKEPASAAQEWYPPHIKFIDAGGNDVTENPENVASIRIYANAPGTKGNEENAQFIKGKLRTYEIDYGAWFNSDEGQSYEIPKDLNGKGFRFYCGTCDNQWFNVVLETSEGVDVIDNQPAFIEKDSRLANIVIDVNKVTDASSLAKAISEQGEEAMKIINHYLHFAYDEENPEKVILYDARAFNFNSGKYPNLQEKEIKIADGFTDNYALTIEYERSRKKGDKGLYIHDTDKANMNICVRLPGTTLADIFDYDPTEKDVSSYHVLTKDSRDALLGTKEEPGHIDNAIVYLTDSNVLIGSQIMRLQQSESNIKTQQETTTNSESVIRDLDMAKAMVEFTKNNVLMQSASSMLSQANQNASGVLGLLQ